MEFIDKEHKLFWEEKNLVLQKYGKTDVVMHHIFMRQ